MSEDGDNTFSEAMFDMGRMFGGTPTPDLHDFAFGGFRQHLRVQTDGDRSDLGATFAVQGHLLWHSAPVLARYLAELRAPPPGGPRACAADVCRALGPVLDRVARPPAVTRIAELGSGAGLTGILLGQIVSDAAAIAATEATDATDDALARVHVLLTDHDDAVLRLLDENVRANPDAARVCAVRALDWTAALAPGGLAAGGTGVGAEWVGACDAVVAADVMHRTDLYRALFAAAAQLLRRGQPFVVVSGLWRYAWDAVHPAAEAAGLAVVSERTDEENQAIVSVFTKT